MRFLLDDLQWQDRRSVAKCRECRTYGEPEAAVLCGWHENVVAAAATVDALLREQPNLLDGDR